ncbi:cyclophane-forming radical SAM/SPASM peptide maturase YhhB [Methylobacterium durans]|uniref:Radical SAM protein n=1 Tax=Methylobacterium durans TaxID=2202825 RepID=A0A2U8W8Q5_9HYPH|nr:cyclophane-forming radical SAM/SPASM peptide maturase YhhB [Methylobacterium durans]AWN42515.1 radical SAM protein [Methylobacterium durans]
MITVDTVLLKLASRCNLDCGYCYVYHMGDDAWRTQPKRMSPAVLEAVAARLGELGAAQGRGFSVVLHGGEPLLVGTVRFAEICRTLRRTLPPSCALHLQTNGVLLSDGILATCAACDVGVSISVDGPAAIHDRHRTDHRGGPSHGRVMAGIERLLAHPAGPSLFTGVLAVVDLASDPADVYAFLKATGAPSIDFLYRDGNNDVLPVGKASLVSAEYGEWMGRLLDVYLADPKPTRVRVLDDMLKLLLGGEARKEGVGLNEYGIIVIDTDGSVNKNDTLKSAFGAADRFATGWSVLTHDLRAVVRSPEFVAYHHSQRPAAPACLGCRDLTVCGAGMPAHRWSRENGFANPSVFCADQRYLIDQMRRHLARHKLAA